MSDAPSRTNHHAPWEAQPMGDMPTRIFDANNKWVGSVEADHADLVVAAPALLKAAKGLIASQPADSNDTAHWAALRAAVASAEVRP